MRRHIDLPGLRWHRIEPELTGDPGLAPFRAGHDLFGDGSLVLLPTPGTRPARCRCWCADRAGRR